MILASLNHGCIDSHIAYPIRISKLPPSLSRPHNLYARVLIQVARCAAGAAHLQHPHIIVWGDFAALGAREVDPTVGSTSHVGLFYPSSLGYAATSLEGIFHGGTVTLKKKKIGLKDKLIDCVTINPAGIAAWLLVCSVS